MVCQSEHATTKQLRCWQDVCDAYGSANPPLRESKLEFAQEGKVDFAGEGHATITGIAKRRYFANLGVLRKPQENGRYSTNSRQLLQSLAHYSKHSTMVDLAADAREM